MSESLTPISLDESKRLIAREGVIKAGLSNFIEVGNALAEIRDDRLYRAEHATFEAYCRDKWGMSKPYATRVIGAAKVAEAIQAEVPIGTESQARPLTQLETPEQQQTAWTAAVEKSGGKPTAKDVQAAVDEVKAAETEVIPPEKQKPVKYQPSNGLMYVDNAISQLAKIKPNDTQRTRAFNKLAKWVAENQ